MHRFFLPLLFLFPFFLKAQDNTSISVQKISSPITVDGRLDEPIWSIASVASHFQKSIPIDSGKVVVETEVRMAFDEKYLYIGATCWQDRSTYTIQSLKRDFGGGTSDAFNVLLDPYLDGLNGFIFTVNPMGVQREGLIFNGSDASYEWDNKWRSEVHNEADRWTVEMAIPFSTLRYKITEGQNQWNVNFIRTTMSPWEVSTWGKVPRPFSTVSLAFCQPMLWESPPPPAKANISVIPYVSSNQGINFIRNETNYALLKKERVQDYGFGGDAKIAITPSLNLDLTFNPDFSQVEVDEQVANLSRFELFFPERRQFFLENRDLFAFFGFPQTRPFFSRRIGLSYNPVSESYEQVPIFAGARLSGKINNNWRIGLINTQTKRKDYDADNVLPAANFGVLALQRKMFARSALSAVFVNKQNFTKDLTDTQKADWNTNSQVAGLEYNLYSKDNSWEGEWYYHRSFSPREDQRDHVFASFLGYSKRNYGIRAGYNYVGENYYAEAGFVPRTGVQGSFVGADLRAFPDWTGRLGKKVNNYGISGNLNLTHDLSGRLTDRSAFIGPNIEFKDQSSIAIGYVNDFTYLQADFDPTNLYEAGTEALPAGSGYNYGGLGWDMFSSKSYNLQGAFNGRISDYFNGKRVAIKGSLAYRYQPYGLFSVVVSYNDIRLPAPYASAQFWLVGPKAELSFSKKLFCSAFFQYNTQSNNFNINTRLQYRFAPVSDIYLVYTDNSFAENVGNTEARFFLPKNRAIVLKVLYWLNV